MNRVGQVKAGKLFQKWDLLIAAVVIVVLACAIAAFFLPSGESVEIYIDGKRTYVLLLSHDQTVHLEGLLDVVIQDGSVFVRNASCPDKLCEHHLPVHDAGHSIVCLPGRVSIVVKGKAKVDVVS